MSTSLTYLPTEIESHISSYNSVLSSSLLDKDIDYPKLDQRIRHRLQRSHLDGNDYLEYEVEGYRFRFKIEGGEFITAINVYYGEQSVWSWSMPPSYNFSGLDINTAFVTKVLKIRHLLYRFDIVGYTSIEEEGQVTYRRPDIVRLVETHRLRTLIPQIAYLYPILLNPDDSSIKWKGDVEDLFFIYNVISMFLFHLIKYKGYWNLHTFHMAELQESDFVEDDIEGLELDYLTTEVYMDIREMIRGQY